jgi:hypothetical protein
MASADITLTKTIATIQSDSTQRTVTLAAGGHYVVTNVGANGARVGVAGVTLSAFAAATNSDGDADLVAGGSMVLERGSAAFVHKSAAGTSLRVSSGAG